MLFNVCFDDLYQTVHDCFWRPLPTHSHLSPIRAALENFILFARRDEIFRMSLDIPELIDVRLPLGNLTGASGLDWDDQTDRIFWTDVLQDTINSANSNVSWICVLCLENFGSSKSVM